MTHREKLLEVYDNSSDVADIEIPQELKEYLSLIVDNVNKNKGVFTVLTTLLTHKLLYPEQDIRYFQAKMNNGILMMRFITEIGMLKR